MLPVVKITERITADGDRHSLRFARTKINLFEGFKLLAGTLECRLHIGNVELHRLGTSNCSCVSYINSEGNAVGSCKLFFVGLGIGECESAITQAMPEGEERTSLELVNATVAHVETFLVLNVKDILIGTLHAREIAHTVRATVLKLGIPGEWKLTRRISITQQKLYLGTNQGVYLTDYPLQTSITPERPQYIHGITGQVWSLQNVMGSLLCGCDNGAFVIEGNTAHKIDKLSGTWGFVELHKHPGYILACDYNGFVILKKNGNAFQLQNRVKGIDLSGGGFIEDNDGSIWLSHWQQGVYHFNLSDDLTHVTLLEYFHQGHGLTADDNNLICKIDGKVYISSADGFKTYNRSSHQLVKADNINKIFNTYGAALRVIETPSKDLWAYKPNYLAIAQKKSNGQYNVKSFAYTNVINRLQMSLGHMGFLDNNHTLMNYDNGFYVMNHQFTAARKPEQVFVRSVYSTNANDTILYEKNQATSVEKLVIPKSLNSLRIEYVLPEFRDNQAVSYSYYLENYDRGWSSPTVATAKEYTKLSKGKYVFHVKAHDMLYNTTSEAKIEIEILPAWYETWWAYFIYFTLAILAAWWFIKYLIKRSQRELERIKAEKERQLREQEALFQIEEEKKEKELVKLRNEQLVIDLKHKSSQLADSTMNLVRKNDMLQELDEQMQELSGIIGKDTPKTTVNKMIKDVRRSIQRNIKEDENWEKFEENFNLVYDNFMKKLTEQFPDLKANDKKLCAYLRMGLSSKEMASLLNTTLRSIETARYRLRKKLNLKQGQNLTSFIQDFG